MERNGFQARGQRNSQENECHCQGHDWIILNNIEKFSQRIFGNFLICLSKIDWKATDVILFWNLARNPKKIHQKFAEKMQMSTKKVKKIGNSIIPSRKNVDDFWLKFWDWRTVQRSALCRSRRELSNEYLLAKIGVDTAENEPLEIWGKIQFTIHFTP